MHTPVSAEVWSAMRTSREGAPPIYPLLAAISGLHVTTIRERASREGWKKRNFQKTDDLDDWRAGVAAFEAFSAERAEALGETAPVDGADGPASDEDGGEAVAALPPEERLSRLIGFFLKQAEAIVASTRNGTVDKARMDGLWSMIRVLERAEIFVRERAEEKQTRSDEELAEILRRIDGRIVELARFHAGRLGETECRPGAG